MAGRSYHHFFFFNAFHTIAEKEEDDDDVYRPAAGKGQHLYFHEKMLIDLLPSTIYRRHAKMTRPAISRRHAGHASKELVMRWVTRT